jgi:hypothetical protein
MTASVLKTLPLNFVLKDDGVDETRDTGINVRSYMSTSSWTGVFGVTLSEQERIEVYRFLLVLYSVAYTFVIVAGSIFLAFSLSLIYLTFHLFFHLFRLIISLVFSQ